VAARVIKRGVGGAGRGGRAGGGGRERSEPIKIHQGLLQAAPAKFARAYIHELTWTRKLHRIVNRRTDFSKAEFMKKAISNLILI
jgi:hypothetical protein